MGKLLLTLVLALMLWACGTDDDVNTTDIRTKMEALSKEIESISITTCTSSGCEQQSSCGCETMGYGKKPCGGPWQYVIYSSSSTDEQLLISKIDEYNELNQLLNQQEGLVSDCSLEPVPVVECFEGKCTATSR